MEITYRDVVSRVQQFFNTADKDMFIPRRLILHIFKSKSTHFLLQKLNEKKLFQNQDIFRWIDCIEMEEIPKAQCNIKDFVDCERIMRSKKRLPEILNTDYGYAILQATNLDHTKDYEVKPLAYYNQLKNREHFELYKGRYLYIINGYVYAPETRLSMVSLLALTMDERFEEFSDCNKEQKCVNYWDMNIKLPQKYYELSIQETVNELSTRLSIPKDENPNLDSNEKSATTQ